MLWTLTGAHSPARCAPDPKELNDLNEAIVGDVYACTVVDFSLSLGVYLSQGKLHLETGNEVTPTVTKLFYSPLCR